MTLYEKPSFTVPASAGSKDYCAEHGHTLPDIRGKCLRCGAKVRAAEVVESWIPEGAHEGRLTTTPCSDPEPPEAA